MKLIAATTAILMTSATAFAADAIVYEEPAAVVVVDTFSWTGGYIGVNAGYAGGKFKNALGFENDTVEAGARFNHNGNGFVGGIQAGYNWQFDQAVFGIETDIQASGIKAKSTNTIVDLTNGDALLADELTNKISWFGTTRARIGYTPVDRFLVYATGGVAYGKVKSSIDMGVADITGTADDRLVGSTSKTKVGYTVGAGAEYAVTNNWTVKGEYLFTDLGKSKFSNVKADSVLAGETKVNFHTVRLGVNYKF